MYSVFLLYLFLSIKDQVGGDGNSDTNVDVKKDDREKEEFIERTEVVRSTHEGLASMRVESFDLSPLGSTLQAED